MRPERAVAGKIYLFQRDRSGNELVREITDKKALEYLRGRRLCDVCTTGHGSGCRGHDVYTHDQSAARDLARRAFKGAPIFHGSHEQGSTTDEDTGEEVNTYFAHFHPGGRFEEYGHVFFGQRGHRVGDKRHRKSPSSNDE